MSTIKKIETHLKQFKDSLSQQTDFDLCCERFAKIIIEQIENFPKFDFFEMQDKFWKELLEEEMDDKKIRFGFENSFFKQSRELLYTVSKIGWNGGDVTYKFYVELHTESGDWEDPVYYFRVGWDDTSFFINQNNVPKKFVVIPNAEDGNTLNRIQWPEKLTPSYRKLKEIAEQTSFGCDLFSEEDPFFTDSGDSPKADIEKMWNSLDLKIRKLFDFPADVAFESNILKGDEY